MSTEIHIRNKRKRDTERIKMYKTFDQQKLHLVAVMAAAGHT